MADLRNRRAFLRSALPAAAPFVQTRRRAPRRPNVVIFLTDDHGAWATGAYGAKDVRTPHIDSLARSGVKFTRAFAATPVCSPSRMTYMTGCLPSAHGVQDWLVPEDSYGPQSRAWLDGHLTWAEVLKGAGYTLGMTGKWHMGRDETPQRGFTEWATVPGGGGTYLNPVFSHNGVRTPVEGFKTDAVGDFALEFLNQQKSGGPFCLYVPFYAPHTPYDRTPAEYREPYRESGFRDFPAMPMRGDQNRGLAGMFDSRKAKLGYSSLVTAADANMGRVLKRLEELSLREETLVIFAADQGWNAGHHGVWGKGNGTIPFNMLEESIRVPLIWNHAGRIRAGASAGPLVSSYDFFPSLLEYLDIAAPADGRRIGRSYAGFLAGSQPERWRTRLVFEYAYVRAIRTENLKYVERAEGFGSEMYDLEADATEGRNVHDDPGYRKQRDGLSAELRESFRRIGAPPLEQWRETTKQRLPKYE